MSLLKAGVFLASLLPLGYGMGRVLSGDVVEPLEFLTRLSGDWVLYFLVLTLCMTPLRRLSGWSGWIQLRRMLGLYAFFYALLHFLCFLWFDHFFDVEGMWRDVLKRPFITVGFVALVLLLPLALTSTQGMQRRLGGKRWRWLHRLVYVILPLGVLHFWWMKAAKHNLSEPALFAGLTLLLLGFRVAVWWRGR